MNQIVQGQICVVTGGAQEIGWATSQALAAQGGKVYLCTYSATSLAQAAHARQQARLRQCGVVSC